MVCCPPPQSRKFRVAYVTLGPDHAQKKERLAFCQPFFQSLMICHVLAMASTMSPTAVEPATTVEAATTTVEPATPVEAATTT